MPNVTPAHTEAALQAIAESQALDLDSPWFQITSIYAQDIDAIRSRPDNQDGADKSWVWRSYEYCRRHFRQVSEG